MNKPVSENTAAQEGNTPRSRFQKMFVKYHGRIVAASLLLGFALLALGACCSAARPIVIVIWTLGPPVFFFAEYYCLEPHLRKEPAEFARFMALQQRAGAIWAGVVALFALEKFSG